MHDTAMVPRKPDGQRPERRPLVDEELADQLLGKAQAEGGRGAGDQLVRAVERWARNQGAEVLRLDVADGNASASALYERNGFRYTGEVGEMMPDGVRRERVMAMPLTKPSD